MGRRAPAPPARDRGRRSDDYQLGGGIPWPRLGDGTEWRDGVERIRQGDKLGRLRSVEWCHPDGAYMATRTGKPTKAHPDGKPLPGEWFGIVSWDEPDAEDRPAARQKLSALVVDKA